MRPHAMQNHRAPTYSIDEQQVSSEMALREATPLLSRLAEPVLAEGRREPLSGNQEVKHVLEGFDVEIGMPASVSIVALEARQND